MKRRDFLRSVGCAAGTLVAAGAAQAGEAAKKPNIVLLFVDDLSEKNDLSATQGDKVKELTTVLRAWEKKMGVPGKTTR